MSNHRFLSDPSPTPQLPISALSTFGRVESSTLIRYLPRSHFDTSVKLFPTSTAVSSRAGRRSALLAASNGPARGSPEDGYGLRRIGNLAPQWEQLCSIVLPG